MIVKAKNVFPKMELGKTWYDNSADTAAVLNIMVCFKIYDNKQIFVYRSYMY